MRKIIFTAFAMLVFIMAACAGESRAEVPGSSGEYESILGNFAFKKQIYMNPLSSFLALDGFQEYYSLSEKAFMITDRSGNQRCMNITCHKEPLDEAAFRNGFMMEELGIPDLSSYQEKCQYTLAETDGSSVYRLYLLDHEIWLAQIHKDSANRMKNEYIWSIFQIERYEGEIPLAFSMYGTQDGVDGFLAFQKDFHSGYNKDVCYNITPYVFGENRDYSVFKYDESCASFLVYENKVYSLGEWFGGYGVTSMAFYDMNDDGDQELYFTYSFGSGLHRSHIAYFDPALKQIVPIEYTHLDKDMIVARNEAGGLSLYDAIFLSMESFVQYNMKSTGLITDIVYEGGRIRLDTVPKE